MLFVSCAKEDLLPDTTTGRGITLVVPLATVGEQAVADGIVTRVPSDPGYDETLPSPNHLYLWVCLQKTSSSVAVLFKYYDMTNQWSYSDGHYTKSISEFLPDITGTSISDSVGRIYAIASTRALSKYELHRIYNGIPADNYATGNYLKRHVDSSKYNLLDNAVFTPDSVTPWTSDDLRDLYSSLSYKNDIHITHVDSETGKADTLKTFDNLPVKLYHSAARVDFQWESTTAVTVNSIKIKDLPTTCKIFQPTQNTNADGEMTITTDVSNKWIGRKYIYVFQPYNPSTLTYDVKFDGKDEIEDLHSPAAISGDFTTWYRIRANINP